MNSLAVNCVYSLVLGIFLGLSYDAVRVLRALFCVSDYGCRNFYARAYKGRLKNRFDVSHGKVFKYIFITVTDVLYFVYCGVVYAVFLYVVNNGIFRWFFLFSSVVGFLVNRFTVGRVLTVVFEFIFQTLRLIVNVIISVIAESVESILLFFGKLRARLMKK